VERLIEVVDLRHMRIGEDLRQDAPLPTDPRLDRPVRLVAPAAIPTALILPVLRIADAGLRLDVVPPRVFDTLARGPHLLARDRAGVTSDAFIEIQNLAYLGPDFHSWSSSAIIGRFSTRGRSRQSRSRTLRRMMNSSRFDP